MRTINPERWLQVRDLLVDEALTVGEAAERMGVTRNEIWRTASKFPEYFEDTPWKNGLPCRNGKVGRRRAYEMFREYRLLGGGDNPDALLLVAAAHRVAPSEARRIIDSQMRKLGNDRYWRGELR